MGDHPRLVEVYAEERQDSTVELEAYLAGVPVGLPLELRVLGGLAGHLVLQFEGEHGYAVDGEDHVHRLVGLPLRVVPLSVDFDAVLRIQRGGSLVQRGLRLEETHLEGNAQVLEAVPDDADDTVADAGVVELQAELALGVDLVLEAEPGPRLRLRVLDEIRQDAVEEAQVGAVGRLALSVAAFRGQEEGLYVALEAFLGLVDVNHNVTFALNGMSLSLYQL